MSVNDHGIEAIRKSATDISGNNSNYAIQVKDIGSLVTEEFDYIERTNPDPDAVTEVYTYKMGGSGGTTVATVTVVYRDSTKADFLYASVS